MILRRVILLSLGLMALLILLGGMGLGSRAIFAEGRASARVRQLVVPSFSMTALSPDFLDGKNFEFSGLSTDLAEFNFSFIFGGDADFSYTVISVLNETRIPSTLEGRGELHDKNLHVAFRRPVIVITLQ